MLLMVKSEGSHDLHRSPSGHGRLVQCWITDYSEAVTEARVSKSRQADRQAEAVVSQAGSSPSAGFRVI